MLLQPFVNGQMTDNLVDPTSDSLVGQFSSSGSLIAGYTYGAGLVSQVTPTSANYYQFDGLGSTVGITNASSGTIASVRLLADRYHPLELGNG